LYKIVNKDIISKFDLLLYMFLFIFYDIRPDTPLRKA